MKKILTKVKKVLKLIRARYPSPLPVGMSEFNAWYASFVDLYDDLPTKDEDSIKNVLASNIINLGHQTVALPKYHFYMILKASAAKQIAGEVFQEIQIKHREARKAAQEAAAQEAALKKAADEEAAKIVSGT